MNTKDIKNFFSVGMGWPILIVIVAFILLVVFHPFDGTTMLSRQPLAALCRIQSKDCTTNCAYTFLSAAEICRPIPFGNRPNQITVPEGCPCSAETYNHAILQQEILYAGAECKHQQINCTCFCYQ